MCGGKTIHSLAPISLTTRHLETQHGICIGYSWRRSEYVIVKNAWFNRVSMNKRYLKHSVKEYIKVINGCRETLAEKIDSAESNASNLTRYVVLKREFESLFMRHLETGTVPPLCANKECKLIKKGCLDKVCLTMLGILKVSEQIWFCLNCNKRVYSNSNSLKGVESGNLCVSEGFMQFLVESFMQTVTVREMELNLNRFFRNHLTDTVLMKLKEEEVETARRMHALFAELSDDEFKRILTDILPQKSALCNFILKYYDFAIKPQVEEAIDKALFEGVKIEGEKMVISINSDGTFKSARNLVVQGKKFHSVLMTNCNQKGYNVHVPVYAPSENGQALIECLKILYEKCILYTQKRKIPIRTVLIVICLDDFKTHKNLPSRVKPFFDLINQKLKALISVSLIVRECILHVFKRWKKIPVHPDRALLLECVK